MNDELAELRGEFLLESAENLDKAEQALLALERDATDKSQIGTIFRAIHTIKGTCGFLGLGSLEKLTHIGESLLSELRDGKASYTPPVPDVLLALIDRVRKILARVEATTSDEGTDNQDMLARIADALLIAKGQLVVPQKAEAQEASAATEEGDKPVRKAKGKGKTRAKPKVELPAPARRPTDVGLAKPLFSMPPIAIGSPALPQFVEPGLPPAPAQAPAPAPIPPQAAAKAPSEERTTGPERKTIRVDVELLDQLMTLVGELVLARNRLLELISNERRTTLAGTSQRIDHIVTQLQQNVTRTRMQPINQLWNRVPRAARDVAQQCHKKVRVELLGGDTELDKTVIEAISEPLSHLIRNCIDHGVEKPERRVEVGKPAEGVLCLRAFHDNGQVMLEISDDGGGIDANRLRTKALEKGMFPKDVLDEMSDRDAVNLIFAPGFSTAEAVSNISGRGVGMDVVRSNIDRLGGAIDVVTQLGLGTTFRIRIPLTLAIAPAIIVASGNQRFAIPQMGVQEIIRVGRDKEGKLLGVEELQGAAVLRRRGALLPLVWLDSELALEGTKDRHVVHVVTLRVENTDWGIVVDEITNSEEIVVKPLGPLLAGLSIFSGTTILGDGDVALILDAVSLAMRAGIGRTATAVREAKAVDLGASWSNSNSFVLAATWEGARIAVPFEQVDRLEKIPSQAIERTAQGMVLQYRGAVLPVSLLGATGIHELPDLGEETKRIPLIVYGKGTRQIGLVIEEIVDVVNVEFAEGRGQSVVDGRVTDIVDLDAIVRRAGLLPDVPEPNLGEAQWNADNAIAPSM